MASARVTGQRQDGSAAEIATRCSLDRLDLPNSVDGLNHPSFTHGRMSGVPSFEPLTQSDVAAVTAQLGREPRGSAGVAWRCPCGKPGVVATNPRLPDGTPFPTTYYLTCPRATAGCSTLEAEGLMADMTERLTSDPELASGYTAAHEAYLADRAELGDVTEIAGISAGGMPSRVKCLHVLAAHSLAAGPGVNPLGDETLTRLGEFWLRPCLSATDPEISPDQPGREPEPADRG